MISINYCTLLDSGQPQHLNQSHSVSTCYGHFDATNYGAETIDAKLKKLHLIIRLNILTMDNFDCGVTITGCCCYHRFVFALHSGGWNCDCRHVHLSKHSIHCRAWQMINIIAVFLLPKQMTPTNSSHFSLWTNL